MQTTQHFQSSSRRRVFVLTGAHVPLLSFKSTLSFCIVLCVNTCHYCHGVPWWSWGVHSDCFLWWHASKCSLEGCTPASGSISSPVHTNRTQTWGSPSDTSHSCPSVHSTYTGELWGEEKRREESENNVKRNDYFGRVGLGWGLCRIFAVN